MLTRRAARDPRARPVHDEDAVRARGARVGVERRHRARLRHQRQAHVDDGVDDRGRVRGADRDPRRAAAERHARQHRRGGRGRDRARRCCCARSSSRSSRACTRCRCASSAESRSACSSASCSLNVDARNQSVVDLYLFVAALVLVTFVVRNRRDDTGWSLSAQVKPIPERLRSLWYVRRLPTLGFAVLFGFLLVLPAVPVAAVAAVPVDRDRDLRADRGVDHAARGLGRPAVARPVRVRRARRADARRAARRATTSPCRSTSGT